MAVYRWWAIAFIFATAVLIVRSGASAHQRKAGNSGAFEQATVSGSAFAGANGSIKVNETAGNGNTQANITVVSTTPVFVVLSQSAKVGMKESGDASIAGNAFAGSFGAIQFNQSAGSGNTQGNVIVLQLGGDATELSDGALSLNVSSNSNPGRVHSSGGSNVCASQASFSHSGGVVQVNQAAGSANHTINSFQLQLQTRP